MAVATVLCLWVTPQTGDPGLDRPLQWTLILILLVYVPYSIFAGRKAPDEKPAQPEPPVRKDKH